MGHSDWFRVKILNIVVFFLCTINLQSSGYAQEASVTRYRETLRELCTSWHGQHANILVNFTPQSGENAKPPSKSEGTTIEVWVGEDGQTIGSRLSSRRIVKKEEDLVRVQASDSLWTQAYRFFRNETLLIRSGSEEQPRVSDSAWLNKNTPDDLAFAGKGLAFGPSYEVFGVDHVSGLTWLELLDLQDGEITTKIDGELMSVLVDSPSQGKFTFSFDANIQEPKLVKVSIIRAGQQLPPTLQLEKFTTTISGFEYGDRRSGSYIASVLEVNDIRESKDSRTTTTTKKITVESVDPARFSVTPSSLLDMFNVADGTKVNVLNDKGIPYKFSGGELVKVIDSGIANEAAKFRAPEPSNFYLILAIAVCSIFGLIAWVQFKKFRS